MDNQELKNILIEELGTMPFKDKKKIKYSGTIPDELLEFLMTRNKKRKKFAQILLIVLSGLLLISFILDYWLKEVSYSTILLRIFILMQLFQLFSNVDYKDFSKKELIFRLFKKIKIEEKSQESDSV